MIEDRGRVAKGWEVTPVEISNMKTPLLVHGTFLLLPGILLSSDEAGN